VIAAALREREAAPVADSEECASCEAAGATDGLCDDCHAFVRVAANHGAACRCGVCTLAGAAQWAQNDARGWQ
jgi:hypothetical protein